MTFKTCECGATFKASPAGVTVRCPACRAAARAPKAARVVGPKFVEAAGRTCTCRTATRGVCGAPAVVAFTAASGEVFAECTAHRAVAA